MAPPKRPLKPHLRRQIRQAALLANPTRDPAQDFTVQGYEASLIKGKGEKNAKEKGNERGGVVGGMLIAWDGVRPVGMEEIMVDRHDILHLLKTLPNTLTQTPIPPPSPTPSTAFTDLPSDAEDTFFFSSDEAEDYQRGKKRRRMEVGREERVRAKEVEGLREMEDRARERALREDARLVAEKAEREMKAEEPPPDLLHTMRHTLTSLLSSPNPQILELRILTHHGSDPRFAFLRADGRWRAYWEGMKADAKNGIVGKEMNAEVGKAEVKEAKVVGIGGLMGAYADSDESSDDEVEEGQADEAEQTETAAEGPDPASQQPLSPDEDLPPPADDIVPSPPNEAPMEPPGPPTKPTAISEEAKAARRARAKEWAEKRRAEGGGS